jgi:hypothetical protein
MFFLGSWVLARSVRHARIAPPQRNVLTLPALADALLAVPASAKESFVLYNRANYFPPDLSVTFGAETGIKVITVRHRPANRALGRLPEPPETGASLLRRRDGIAREGLVEALAADRQMTPIRDPDAYRRRTVPSPWTFEMQTPPGPARAARMRPAGGRQ